MLKEMLCLVVDCYPNPRSEAFRRFAGAVASCWIRSDLCRDEALAERFLARRLDAAGWSIARILVQENVSSESYANKSDGRRFYEQAQVDGFVVSFHTCARQTIGDTDLDDEHVIEALLNLSSSAMDEGVMSLYSDQDAQWANGVTPNGDEFLPMWLSRRDAVTWQADWPNYALRYITFEDRQAGIFERINESNMWIALGIEESLLTICHPVWVRNDLFKGEVNF